MIVDLMCKLALEPCEKSKTSPVIVDYSLNSLKFVMFTLCLLLLVKSVKFKIL